MVLDDRFLLVEEIGRGGMSTIFRAEDLQDHHRSVVVKIPLPVFSSGLGSWSLFQREEEIGLKLDHPFVLKFLPLPGPARQRNYVATEFVAGETLHRYLRRQGRLPEPEALRIASQICAAVAHLHERGFVHYDVKPGNVILCPDGSIRLIDFGLAHDVVTRRFSLAAQAPAIGSAEYVAPEQIRRRRGRTSADVYAIGAILYTMLTGQAPFPDDDPFVVASARTLGDPPAPRSLHPDVSPQAEEIALRALRRDPGERFTTAAAMRAALDDPASVLVTGLSERLEPVTFGRRFRRIAQRVFLVGVLPVALQVGLFLLLWHHHAQRR
jgi:serine/threonine-protein kinase